MAQSRHVVASIAKIVEYCAASREESACTSPFQRQAIVKTMLDIKEILKNIPHRYPFLLVDRVLELHGEEKIVAIKNVSFNEPFFQGHFPARPVMPGVLICEAMAQVGAIFVHNTRGGMDNGKVFVLTGLERVKFKRPVEPGDQLRLELCCLKRRGSFWKMQGIATVDGKVVAQAEISAMEVDMF
jgi:beta-hydroxyacyl-ACP dehydratase FabZ